MNITLLKQAVDDKLVSVQKHPEAELYIYNYTQKVQFERLWNEITTNARGLILDGNHNVVAQPFGKFFNLGEHTPEQIPNLAFDVYEKMDGSLGILYWINNLPYIATRGSFTSEQAIHATEVLHNKYLHLFDKLDKTSTYLFEIIYPENRIVVDYGKTDDLILLTIIDKDGNESTQDIGFPVVKKYDGINSIEELKSLEEANKEGFVIRFNNGFRVKMKFDEYVRLHKIVTGVSNISVWEYLKDDRSFDELLDKVPDEFYQWIKDTRDDLCVKFSTILNNSLLVYKELDTRKETALYFQEQEYPSVLFSMLNKRNPKDIIWKMIKPKYSKPFKKEVEC